MLGTLVRGYQTETKLEPLTRHCAAERGLLQGKPLPQKVKQRQASSGGECPKGR